VAVDGGADPGDERAQRGGGGCLARDHRAQSMCMTVSYVQYELSC
jgi:hypothetical protein